MARTPVSSRLEFRVLGPVEAARDGRPIELGGKRQRALLAALLIDANRTVSTSRLIEELFGSEVSRVTENRVQAGILRLRRALDNGDTGNGAASVLVTRPGGYLLRVDSDQLDYARFEQLSEEGREALSRHDPATAATLLRRGLSLWRGPAFGDLSLVELAQGEIRRLDELRVAAVMDRVSADMMLGADAELVPELEAMVAEHPLQERLLGQLMLALYRSGRQADALEVYRVQRRILRDRLGLDPGPSLAELERSILRHDPDVAAVARVPRGPAVGNGRVTVCPYKGLAPFDAADAEFFCGRDRVIDDLLARVASSRLVGVIGASGVGKSSIVRAGLVPALAAGSLPGSGTWTVSVLRPGAHPLRSLRRAVKDTPAGTARAVIVVDQFEEAFTACGDADECRRFVARLVDLACDPDTRTVVTVALRSDFYGSCAAFPAFAELLSQNHILVTAMGPADLATAIELPTELAGLALEAGLAEALIADVVDEPGGLPLLSTTLLELWGTRDGRTLTVEGYRAAGGVRSAVTRLAETAYSRLTDNERTAARAIFMRLAVGEGATLARRRAALTEFDLEGDPATRQALEVMTELRLLTVSEDAVEVAHETLLREWPRLTEWLEHDRDGRRIRAHLANAAAEWQEGGHDPEELYRGARLSAALEWSETSSASLNLIEREFIEAAATEADRDIRAQRRQNRRLRWLLAGVVCLLGVAAVAGLAADVQRSRADRSATSAVAQSLGAEAVSEPQIDRALLLATEGTRLADSAVTKGDLLATVMRSPQMVGTFYTPSGRPDSVAVSPDGTRVAIGEYGPQVLVYSTSTRTLIASLHLGASAVAYTPDGRSLVAFATGLHLFDARTDRSERVLPMPSTVPTNVLPPNPCNRCLVISDHGQQAWAAFNNSDKTWLVRWNLKTGASRAFRFPGTAVALVGSGDGRRLAVDRYPKAPLIWSTQNSRLIERARIPAGHEAFALSPDGRTLAIASYTTGDVGLMNLRTRRIASMPNAFTSGINSGAFTPDGRKLVVAGDDGHTVVWEVAPRKVLQTDAGHTDYIQGIAIAADGSTVYTTSLDGSVIGFDLTGHKGYGQPFAGASSLYAGEWSVSSAGSMVALPFTHDRVGLLRGQSLDRSTSVPGFHTLDTPHLSPSGGLLALIPGRGAPGAMLWRVSGVSPERIGVLAGVPARAPSTLDSAAFTPSGGRFVAVDQYGRGPPGPCTVCNMFAIVAYDTQTRRLVGRSARLSSVGNAIAVSPDGARVVVGEDNGRLDVFSLPRLTLVRSTVIPEELEAVAYSPDERTIAVADSGGRVRLVDANTLRTVAPPLPLVGGSVNTVSFNRDGSLLAESGTDGVTHLVDVATWRSIGPPLPATALALATSAFAGNDRLFTFDTAGKGVIWPLSTDALTGHACAIADRNLTREEWREFLPGRAYQPVCARPG